MFGHPEYYRRPDSKHWARKAIYKIGCNTTIHFSESVLIPECNYRCISRMSNNVPEELHSTLNVIVMYIYKCWQRLLALSIDEMRMTLGRTVQVIQRLHKRSMKYDYAFYFEITLTTVNLPAKLFKHRNSIYDGYTRKYLRMSNCDFHFKHCYYMQ